MTLIRELQNELLLGSQQSEILLLVLNYYCSCQYSVRRIPTVRNPPVSPELPLQLPVLPYSGYFSGGKIFVVFVVERRTTKFLPTKRYCIVPRCGLVYRDHEHFSTNCLKIHCSRKFYPTKNTHYTVCPEDPDSPRSSC